MNSTGEWTDRDGDHLRVVGYHDGRAGVLTRRGDTIQSVELTRADALELYHLLGGHLMATGQFPANVVRLHASLPDSTADGYDWPEQPTCCNGEDSSTCCPGPSQPASVALEAHDLVYGDRQGDYGHPREDFTRTAILWTGLLQHKLADGAYIDAEDIGRCMIAVKLSRDVNSPKRDNRVDMAGYAITLDRLETGQ